MWRCPGPCGSCRTWPNMPAPYSKSWRTTSRPPPSESVGFRVKLANFNRPVPNWTPSRRQCVSSASLYSASPWLSWERTTHMRYRSLSVPQLWQVVSHCGNNTHEPLMMVTFSFNWLFFFLGGGCVCVYICVLPHGADFFPLMGI